MVILVCLVFEVRSAEGRLERKITVAKLKDSFGGEEQPRLCQSEIAEPVKPTIVRAKRIWMKRRPHR